MRAHESLLHQVEDRSGLLGSTAPVFRLTARIRLVPVHDHFRSTASRCSLARLPTCARTSELKAIFCFGCRANCAQLASVFPAWLQGMRRDAQPGQTVCGVHCRRHKERAPSHVPNCQAPSASTSPCRQLPLVPPALPLDSPSPAYLQRSQRVRST